MQQAWIVLLVFVYFDCVQAVSKANIMGLGLISKVKYTTMMTYWLIGIPMSCLAMFKFDLALAGLWMGPTIAVALNWGIYNYYVNLADWNEISI